MLRFRQTLLAATILLAVPHLVCAQPINDLYFGAGGGITVLQNDSIKAGSLPGPIGSVHARYQPGWAGVGSEDVASAKDNLAYQGIAGAAFPVAAIPRLAATTEYRLIDEPISRNDTAAHSTDDAAYASLSTVSRDLNQSLLVGLRYALNTTQPGPVTALPIMPTLNIDQPAPAPARSYLLFFDLDRTDLSERALQIIAEAASNSTKVHYTRLSVFGHADLSGTHAYNQVLSLRRANAVAMELVHDGVPETAIVISAMGDTQPLVVTEAGMREPQNRRVEIIIN